MIEDAGSSLVLLGYEHFMDFGLALPLYKKSRTANAWYIAETVKPYDLRSHIARFEIHHPVTPQILPEAHWLPAAEGDPFCCVFLWEEYLRAGNIDTLFGQLSTTTPELTRWAPITIFDLSLHARSNRSIRYARNAYEKVRNTYGANAAKRWLTQSAIFQSSKLDLDKRIQATQPDKLDNEIIDSLSKIFVELTNDDQARIILPDRLSDLFDLSQLAVSDFVTSKKLAALGGMELELELGSGLGIELAEQAPRRYLLEKGSTDLDHARNLQHFEVDPRLSIAGQGLTVSMRFRRHVQEKFIDELTRFGLGQHWAGSVFFSKERQGYICAVKFLCASGTFNARGRSNDPHTAFGNTLRRIANQVGKSRDRQVRVRKRRSKPVNWHDINRWVPNHVENLEISEVESGSSTPLVISETKHDVVRMSIKQAWKKVCDNDSAYSFIELHTGNLCTIYRLPDGNIQLIRVFSCES